MAKTRTTDSVTPLPNAVGNCPICSKPATIRHRPFCSGRCADIDLGRWLKANYRVETNETPDEGTPAPEER